MNYDISRASKKFEETEFLGNFKFCASSVFRMRHIFSVMIFAQHFLRLDFCAMFFDTQNSSHEIWTQNLSQEFRYQAEFK